MQGLPKLFRWEAGTPGTWDDKDGTPTQYTKGQPRGLWTAKPNSQDAADNITLSVWGEGWRTKYFPAPQGIEGGEIIVDPWGRELLFFMDTANNAILVLSRGDDGKFDFASTNTEKTEPLNFTENVDVTTYDPLFPENQDNIYTIIFPYEYSPGYIKIEKIIVLNAVVGHGTHGTTKAQLFRGEGLAQTLVATTPLTDEDADGTPDDWITGSTGSPAFIYNNTTAGKIHTGARYLVFWNDVNNDGMIDAGENFKAVILNITAKPGSNQIPEIRVNSVDFIPLP
jgi:hypothetical protein